MSYKDRVVWQQLTTVTAAALTTSLVSVVTLALPTPLVTIKNGTNGDVLIGMNDQSGIQAKWGFPASSGAAYDIRTNAPLPSDLMLPAGTQLYASWNTAAPGSPTGNLYIELMQVQTL